jgi:hypothetical protein
MRNTLSVVTIFVVEALMVAHAQAHQPVPPAVPAGGAYVDVTVVDAIGAPLEGVTVTISGVVEREAVSNDAGFVTFEELPEGRYDVVASARGFASSVRRVLDLPAIGGTAVPITLKPPAPGSLTSTACGGYDAGSLTTLSATAHLVLHVKVTDQQTIESAPVVEGVRSGLVTMNRVQVLDSFKNGDAAPLAGAIFTIQQAGGRIDRGEYIEFHRFNQLPPLNVGDEYVLFVFVDPAGTSTIVGAEEGAFLVRDGVVHPLGQRGAASTWRGRSTTRFFEALRRLPRSVG